MRMQLRHSKKEKKRRRTIQSPMSTATGKAGVPAFWESFTDVAVGSWLATPAVSPLSVWLVNGPSQSETTRCLNLRCPL